MFGGANTLHGERRPVNRTLAGLWRRVKTRATGAVGAQVFHLCRRRYGSDLIRSRHICLTLPGLALGFFFLAWPIRPAAACSLPVSYTHLTLPTIYSV